MIICDILIGHNMPFSNKVLPRRPVHLTNILILGANFLSSDWKLLTTI